MLSIMLLFLTIVALAQFAAYYGRAVLAHTAARPVSSRVLAAAGIRSRQVANRDFDTLLSLHSLTPALGPSGHGMFFVRIYYRLMSWVGTRTVGSFPRLAAWSRRERTLCARYAAVQLDLRLQASLAFSSSVRSD